jgi:hypothetical protein
MQMKFIAYLDILGFKQLVESNSLEQLKEIYNEFLTGALKETMDNLASQIKTYTRDGWPNFVPETRIISDSIIVWNKNDSWEGFSGLLILVRNMCALALTYGIPLRGAIVMGELEELLVPVKDSTASILLGNGITKAFELEKRQKMMGCIVSPEVIGYIDFLLKKQFGTDIETAFKDGHQMFRYSVPMGDTKTEYYCVNWVSSAGTAFSEHSAEYIVKDAFAQHKKSIEPFDVQTKIRNTVDFMEHCVSLIGKKKI